MQKLGKETELLLGALSEEAGKKGLRLPPSPLKAFSPSLLPCQPPSLLPSFPLAPLRLPARRRSSQSRARSVRLSNAALSFSRESGPTTNRISSSARSVQSAPGWPARGKRDHSVGRAGMEGVWGGGERRGAWSACGCVDTASSRRTPFARAQGQPPPPALSPFLNRALIVAGS